MFWSIILGILLAGTTVEAPGALEGSIRDAIRERVQRDGESAVVESISIPRLPDVVRNGRFFVEPLRPGRVGGRTVVMVDFTGSGSRVRRVPVSCTVRTFGEAYVTTHMMDRHARLTENDLVVHRVETTSLPDDYLRKSASLADLRTRQIIKEGTVLSAGMLEQEPVVHHGDPVILTTIANNVRVSVSAVARQDGRPGSSIIVELAGGHQRFRAKVLDGKNVERVVD